MSEGLCKIVRLEDVSKMTLEGFVPHQPDDLANEHLTLVPKKWLNNAREIYFSGERVRAYNVHREKLDNAGYVVFWEGDGTVCVLIGPGKDPMKPIPIECLHSAVLEM